MIELCVGEYCHDCPEFEPVLRKLEVTTFTGEHGIETQVLCEYHKRCVAMKRYLEKKIKEGEKKENGNVPGKKQ